MGSGMQVPKVSDICCSYFLIALDSVVKPSHKVGDLCPCFRNGDHVYISQDQSGRRGRSECDPGFQIRGSNHYVIHFYSEMGIPRPWLGPLIAGPSNFRGSFLIK